MKKIYSILFFCLGLLSVMAQQAGSLDETFNTFGQGGGFDDTVNQVVLQPDGKILVQGYFTHYRGVSNNGFVRLNADGSIDSDFNPVSVDHQADKFALQPDGKILVSGSFGYGDANYKNLIRLNPDGSQDSTFNYNSITPRSIALQSDGKIVLAFFKWGHADMWEYRVERFNTDGSLDTTFTPAVFLDNGNDDIYIYIKTVVIQSDDKILVAGRFFEFNNAQCNKLIRLNADGSLDSNFVPVFENEFTEIDSVALQTDGKVLVGGTTLNSGGQSTALYFDRLNIDGSQDLNFAPQSRSWGSVKAIRVLPDGKIVVAGEFGWFNQSKRDKIARINTDGTLDVAFHQGEGPYAEFNYVSSCAVQSDGKIFIGGRFSSYDGQSAVRFTQLNGDGTLNSDFSTPVNGASGGIVKSTAVQSDGKILIAGSFVAYNGVLRHGIARLNADGSLDTEFDPPIAEFSNDCYSVVVQSDGKIIIGSLGYLYYEGVGVGSILRLNPDGSFDSIIEEKLGKTDTNYWYIDNFFLLPNDKIIVSYWRSNQDILFDRRIVRLNNNGEIDSSFNPIQNDIAHVKSVVTQPDGNILISGYAPEGVVGFDRGGIIRVDSSGAIINRYEMGNTDSNSTENSIKDIALQSDGKILLNCEYRYFNPNEPFFQENKLQRLNSDFTIDSTFHFDDSVIQDVQSIALQMDGKILVGAQPSNSGSSTGKSARSGKSVMTGKSASAISQKGLTRLNGDGSLDSTFNIGTGPDGTINSISLQSDGKLVIGGDFTSYNGTTKNGVARVNNDGNIYIITLCSGSKVSQLIVPNTVNVKWYGSATSKTALSNTNVLTSKIYYYTQTVGAVTSSKTPVRINLVAKSIAGSISGAGTICYDSGKTLMLSSNHIGTIQWQSASLKDGLFTNIENKNGNTLETGNLTTTTYYKAVVTNGVCPSKNTGVVKVNVQLQSVGGIISGGENTVCYGVNTTKLSLAGYLGSLQWEYSLDNDNFSNVPVGGKGAGYSAKNLAETTYYRTKVAKGTGCTPAYSNTVTVNVKPQVNAGVISGQSTVNYNTSAELLVAGYDAGATLLWKRGSTPTGAYGVSAVPSSGETYKSAKQIKNMYYKVFATFDGCTTSTDPFLVSINSSTARIDSNPVDVNEELNVIAYPNPFNESINLNITTKITETIHIVVYDMLGKRVDELDFSPIHKPMISIGRNYSAGIYNILVNQGAETKILRVIKE